MVSGGIGDGGGGGDDGGVVLLLLSILVLLFHIIRLWLSGNKRDNPIQHGWAGRIGGGGERSIQRAKKNKLDEPATARSDHCCDQFGCPCRPLQPLLSFHFRQSNPVHAGLGWLDHFVTFLS